MSSLDRSDVPCVSDQGNFFRTNMIGIYSFSEKEKYKYIIIPVISDKKLRTIKRQSDNSWHSIVKKS